MTDEVADVLASAERALQDRWPGCRLSDPAPFDGQGSARNLVLRAAVFGGGAGSVVVKRHRSRSGAESPVREPAALTVLPRDDGFLELLAVGDDLIVLADVGDGEHLANRLLGTDPDAAAEGVVAWAGAVGRLHRLTRGRSAAFDSALSEQAARGGRPVPAADPMPALLGDTATALAEQLPALGVHPDPAALEELRRVDDLLGGGEAARTLTPSDACPDNNAFTAHGLVLLDFESAQWRHVAWDAAYLLVPWPSCWCSWRLPADVSAAGLGAWRAAVDLPYAESSGFQQDLSVVRTAWAFISTAWFLERALTSDDSMLRESPTRRAMITHRLAGVVSDPEPGLPQLTRLAEQLVEATTAAWGPHPLVLAPAFRDR